LNNSRSNVNLGGLEAELC